MEGFLDEVGQMTFFIKSKGGEFGVVRSEILVKFQGGWISGVWDGWPFSFHTFSFYNLCYVSAAGGGGNIRGRIRGGGEL